MEWVAEGTYRAQVQVSPTGHLLALGTVPRVPLCQSLSVSGPCLFFQPPSSTMTGRELVSALDFFFSLMENRSGSEFQGSATHF